MTLRNQSRGQAVGVVTTFASSGVAGDEMDIQTLQRRIEDAPMSRLQWRAVAVAFAISLIDGFDVLSATFAAPLLQLEWGLDPSRLGVVLAAGLFGMATGSFVLAPLADHFGRRPLILCALIVATLGMILAADADSLGELTACRAGTGLGIGTIMAVMSSVAAESTNRRWRPFAISLIVVGFPAGGMVAGLTAAVLFPRFGWRAEFVVGALLTASLIPAVLLFLPEPLQSLLARKHPRRLSRVNAMLIRLGQPALDRIPSPPRRGRSYAAIFARGQLPTTAWITIFQLVLMQCVLFVLSWLPHIVSVAGADAATASLAGTAASAAGIAGGMVFGAATNARTLRRRTVISAIGLAVTTLGLGFAPAAPVLLIAVGAGAGIFAYASQAGFYTILPNCFDQQSRATGIGFVLGFARFGSATSPLLAGGLLSAGLGRAAVCGCFAMLAICAASLLAIQPARRPED